MFFATGLHLPHNMLLDVHVRHLFGQWAMLCQPVLDKLIARHILLLSQENYKFERFHQSCR